MGSLATPFESLPLGFRFRPTDIELIDHYLRLKINGKQGEVACIREVDICRVEPWDLPALSAIKTNDLEWFFFCPRDQKYPNGNRSNRATEAGYWKATGKDRTIKSRKMGIIGMKKTLVFYTGRAPKGQRTPWVIHEYRATQPELDGSHPGQAAFVLCRLFKKVDDPKPDDNDDGSHIDEVETNIDSPNPTSITQEDIRSEAAVIQASPLSVEQSVEQRSVSQNCAVKTPESLTTDTAFPDRPMLNEVMTPGVDSFYGDDFSELYFNINSMHENEGPGCMDDIFTSQMDDGQNGLHIQYINGRDPISHFLDSILIHSDAPNCKEAGHQGAVIVESDLWKNTSMKESGSCSESDVEIAQQQNDAGFVNSMPSNKNYNEPNGYKELFQNQFWDDGDVFSDASLNQFCNSQDIPEAINYNPPLPASFVEAEDRTQFVGNNGIQIRTRGRHLPQSYFSEQGSAPRRLRLHREPKSTVTEDSTIAPRVKSVCLEGSAIPPHDDTLCLDDLGENTDEPGSSASEAVGTGVQIRPRIRESGVRTSDFPEQGTAHRRLRLQQKRQSTFSDEFDEKQCADETKLEPDQKLSSSKRPTPVRMVKVVIIVLFIMACLSLWISQNVFLIWS
ncbi:protein NTM1-like 9 isoform X1 [Amaranthus tricolor]|uniref:protein NTM1-like 9 isoform X1 n=1 Tax=Amaranthus tricolor TaxID=29722 RepID=UPI0025866BD3|nr:protein NTM1-like 9 isoform X1 [Amaranthus tricolor]